MRILCEYTSGGPHFVRTGWKNVLEAIGHEFIWWHPQSQSAFDAFSEVEPDWFIGTTYGVDRAVEKNILSRPHMHVSLFASAWGPYLNDVDLKTYPLVVVTDAEKATIERLQKAVNKPDCVFIHAHGPWLEGTMSGWGSIGVPYIGVLNAFDAYAYGQARFDPNLACSATFCGNRWAYKARNIDRFLLPLCHPNSGLSVRIYGSGGWEGIANWLGPISQATEANAYLSSLVCPSVSEPHSTDLGWDVIERPFKTMGVGGGVTISDYVPEAVEGLFTKKEMVFCRTPGEYRDAVMHFVQHPEEGKLYAERGRKEVWNQHCYHHRVAQLAQAVGLSSVAIAALADLEKLSDRTRTP